VSRQPAWIVQLPTVFQTAFDREDVPAIATAPGRVNLIGEHTDYNDGFVLPMAIDRRVGIAFAPRDDRLLRMRSAVFDETHEIPIDDLSPPGGSQWHSYVAGAAWALAAGGHRVVGADLVVDGDVPLGSGLSSSSALVMASILALCEASGLPWAPVEMALLGQKVEREWVGVAGGVMDQFTAVMAQRGQALLLDCRNLSHSAVPIPDEAVVVVMDTGAPRTLAGSAYNERGASCQKAVAVLREFIPEIHALRDVDLEALEANRELLDDTVYRRALHVVTENQRPGEMAEALRACDLDMAGRLMDESHFSLRDHYEVSSAELDAFTEIARQHPACFGARLTGAGFGGCAIALVSSVGAMEFMRETLTLYRKQFDLPSSIFTCRPESGVRIFHL
jgi:galactokinase